MGRTKRCLGFHKRNCSSARCPSTFSIFFQIKTFQSTQTVESSFTKEKSFILAYVLFANNDVTTWDFTSPTKIPKSSKRDDFHFKLKFMSTSQPSTTKTYFTSASKSRFTIFLPDIPEKTSSTWCWFHFQNVIGEKTLSNIINYFSRDLIKSTSASFEIEGSVGWSSKVLSFSKTPENQNEESSELVSGKK